MLFVDTMKVYGILDFGEVDNITERDILIKYF